MARYIDADRLKDAFHTDTEHLQSRDEHLFDLIMFEIDETPTAEVEEVKHGEWKLHPDGSGTCSCCNRTQKFVWDYDNAQNFCGHCGAKMDWSEDE